jgi:hypothetical protein
LTRSLNRLSPSSPIGRSRLFLGDRNDEPQVRFDHLLLGPARLALAALHGPHDPAELSDRQLRLGGDLGDGGAVFGDLGGLVRKARPAAVGQWANALKPVGREFVPQIMIKELSPPEADCLGEPQQPALLDGESAIELVELLDEMLDARAIEAHSLEQFDAL